MIRHFLACCIAAVGLLASALASAQVAVSGPYWPGPAVSGSWYDPARSGEGLILQFLPNGKALVIWFTYPPAGEAAEQAWLITELGGVDGSKRRFNAVYRPQGGIFGDAFNPDNISSVVWGTMELEFRDCNMLTLRYAGPPAFGSGERTMTRLTSLDQLACNGTRALTITGARALEGLRAKSGAWYVPSRSEGWMIEELPDGRSLVYWFTYDPQGKQAWTIGVGTRDGNRLVIPDNLITRGTRFGSGFDPAQVQGIPWGSLSFNFTSCDSVDVSYASILPGYGSGTRVGTRLSALAGAACLDGTPAPRTNGDWVEAAASRDLRSRNTRPLCWMASSTSWADSAIPTGSSDMIPPPTAGRSCLPCPRPRSSCGLCDRRRHLFFGRRAARR